jgi:Lon protease-like protein
VIVISLRKVDRDKYRRSVAEVIPLFPLSHVLLPGMPLPLHIFESRYRQLLHDVSGDGQLGAFGVVALRSGSEAGSSAPPDVVGVGTLAEILEVEPYDDGASDLLTVGSRRFRVRRLLLTGAPYTRAEIEWLPELDGDLHPAHSVVARRLCADLRTVLTELTGRPRQDELPDDPNLLSYHLAGQLPLDAADRQALLAEPTAADRLRRLIGLLRREVSLVQSTRTIAIAPSVLRLVPHAN